MNKRILFSPVGGTDPISMKNWKDGSILHVCRVYQPDEIYLYMSKEIIELHEKDNRYLYCLDKLYEFLGKEYSVHLIKNEELVNVQDFDVFYEDFRSELSAILSSMDDSDELFINVSSGTPAMKSALIVIKTLGEVNCRMIQVVTPSRSMNEHQHIGYDVELLWEGNEDNVEEFENRCMEIMCPSLSQLRNEEIIKSLINAYDYSGAMTVIETMPKSLTESYRNIVKIAYSRLMLDCNSVSKKSKNYDFDFLPIKNKKYTLFFEYILALEIKLRQKLYPDFIRGLTPAIVMLCEYYIYDKYGLDIDKYTKNTSKGRKWNESKIMSDENMRPVLDAWMNQYNAAFQFGYIKSDNLLCIIDCFESDKASKEYMAIKKMRNIEERIRNTAAHEIAAITIDEIRNKTGITPNEIMKLIKLLVNSLNISPSDSAWNSYDLMNEYIINLMNRKL